MSTLGDRRGETQKRLDELRLKLSLSESIISTKACVYVTGSFGRGDASKFSDLDLFIVGKTTIDKKSNKVSALKRLDDIRVKAQLIEAVRDLGLPDFDADGQYLTHYSVNDLIGTLGHPEDDATNTFTARLLLLLESQPLLGEAVYSEVIHEVVRGYWKDYKDNKNSFIPGFLANDILRLWRTLCINYEVRTRSDTEDDKAARKVKNFKLKHSRLLTCYSSLLFLLYVYREKGTVSIEHVIPMIRMSPTRRLEWLSEQSLDELTRKTLRALLEQYDWFLKVSDRSSDGLISFFKTKSVEAVKKRQYQFGDTMHKALELIGGGTLFHRILTV